MAATESPRMTTPQQGYRDRHLGIAGSVVERLRRRADEAERILKHAETADDLTLAATASLLAKWDV